MKHNEQGRANASAGDLLFTAILGCLTVLRAFAHPNMSMTLPGRRSLIQAGRLKRPRTSDAPQTRGNKGRPPWFPQVLVSAKCCLRLKANIAVIIVVGVCTVWAAKTGLPGSRETPDDPRTRPIEGTGLFQHLTHCQGRSTTISAIGFQTRSFGVISQFKADTAAMTAS
jgi:hypothetical protein